MLLQWVLLCSGFVLAAHAATTPMRHQNPPAHVSPFARTSCVLECLNTPDKEDAPVMKRSVLSCVQDCIVKSVEDINKWLTSFPPLVPFLEEEEENPKPPATNGTRKPVKPVHPIPSDPNIMMRSRGAVDYKNLYHHGLSLKEQLLHLQRMVDTPGGFFDLISFLPTFSNMAFSMVRPHDQPQGFAANAPAPVFSGIFGQVFQTIRDILQQVIQKQQEVLQMIVGCSCNATAPAAPTPPTRVKPPVKPIKVGPLGDDSVEKAEAVPVSPVVVPVVAPVNFVDLPVESVLEPVVVPVVAPEEPVVIPVVAPSVNVEPVAAIVEPAVVAVKEPITEKPVVFSVVVPEGTPVESVKEIRTPGGMRIPVNVLLVEEPVIPSPVPSS